MPLALRSFVAGLVSLGVFIVVLASQSPTSVPPPTENGTPIATVAGVQPKFWKGNLHTHSLWSDGDDFPDMIADWYKQRGYNFLGFTEHNVIAEGDRWIDVKEKVERRKGTTPAVLKKYVDRFGDRWVERRNTTDTEQVRLKPFSEFRSAFDEAGKFLLIPAEEISHKYGNRPIHMNGINLRDVVLPVDGATVGETISVNVRQVQDQRTKSGRKMLTFLNHPNFGWGVTAEDMMAAENLTAFEVFNGHPGVRNYGDAQHAATERIWDLVLARRLGKQQLPRLFGVATDDSHAYHAWGLGKTNPGRGWVMVRAPYLSAEAIVQALEDGDFYASSGVTLEDVVQADGEYRLAIRSEPGVTYTTEFIATLKGTNLDGIPQRGPDGKPLPVTGTYSAEIGRVVARSTEANPVYRFTGKELYVRAKVTSSRPHPNPYAAGDMEMAWTQPVLP